MRTIKLKTPRWTIIYSSHPTREGYRAVHKRFYFSESNALQFFNRAIDEGLEPVKRPWDETADRKFLLD